MRMDFLRKNILTSRKKQPSIELQLRFINRLYQLMNNGYSLIESLKILSFERDLKKLSSISEIELLKGKTFSEVLKKLNFTPLIYNYLYAVEARGSLKEHLLTCIKMLEQRQKYLKKVKEMLRYPLVLFFFFIGIFIVLNQFLLPSFENFLSINEQSLKTVYTIFFFIKFFTNIFFMLIILFILVYVFKDYFYKKVSVEIRIKMMNLIPFFNNLFTLHNTFLFSSQLSTLLSSGMSIKNILEHLSLQSEREILSYYSSLLKQHLEKGGEIVPVLKKLPLLDPQLSIIFLNNMSNHDLAKDLMIYGSIIFDELERKLMKSVTYIQPIILSILAIFIVLMYVALLWPMFNLINNM